MSKSFIVHLPLSCSMEEFKGRVLQKFIVPIVESIRIFWSSIHNVVVGARQNTLRAHQLSLSHPIRVMNELSQLDSELTNHVIYFRGAVALQIDALA